jgi:hypothetical protein
MIVEADLPFRRDDKTSASRSDRDCDDRELKIQYQAGCGIRTARTRLREMAGQPYRSEELKRRRFVLRCRYTTTSVSPIEPPPLSGSPPGRPVLLARIWTS